MSVNSGPKIPSDSLAAYFDLSNQLCFRGEPTTNLARITSDFSGTAYASSDEWTQTVLKKQFDPAVKTPVGSGATLIMESGGTGWHALSRYGGGGSGNFSLSFYIKPVTNDITTVDLGLLADGTNRITFNLNTRAITYNNVNTPRVAFIEDVREHPGWLRVGANLFGRSGGWVGSFGYDTLSQYTGSVSGKQMYVAGAVEQATFAPTKPLPAQTTRGTTVAAGGGLVDISQNARAAEFVNSPSFKTNTNRNYSVVFDGVDDYIITNYDLSWNNTNSAAIEFFCKPNNAIQRAGIVGKPSPDWEWSIMHGQNGATNSTLTFVYWTTGGVHTNGPVINISNFFSTEWVHIVVSWNHNTSETSIYKNGVLQSTDFWAAPSTNQNRTNNIYLGGGIYTWNTGYWNGELSLFRVYNRSLSASEVQRNFNAFRGRFGI